MRNKFDSLTFDKFITNVHEKKKIAFSRSKYTREYKFECQILFERWEMSLKFN